MSLAIGVDIGGTHTDLVARDDRGETTTAKVPTTPDDLPEGVIDGISAIAKSRDRTTEALLAETTLVVHGTTVSTNALLENEAATTGLLTTDGFRDVLELNMESSHDLYELRRQPTVAPIERYRRRTVTERIDADGVVREPLDEASVHGAVDQLLDSGVEAVAVCLLSAYTNDEHERKIRALLADRDVEAVSVSTDVYPSVGVHDRSVATIVDASLKPTMRTYVSDLETRLETTGFDGTLLIMQGNGGSTSAEIVSERPIQSVNSGPAAAAVSAGKLATDDEAPDLISFEMGGTSSDVCLIRNGTPLVGTDNHVGDTRVPIPMVDVTTIGAGGGSIAWIDDRDVLRVGPQSAGSEPGPICYGQGGTDPTVTDANLVLGYLNPSYFLGGRAELDIASARREIEAIAERLDLSTVEAAAGIYELTNEGIVNQVREVSVEAGHDPREFRLVAAGGAGPAHAAAVADRFDTTAVVPRSAGTFSAMGLLEADRKHDFTRSVLRVLDQSDDETLSTTFTELEQEATEIQNTETLPDGSWQYEYSLETRYEGQVHELTVPVEADPDLDAVATRHHERHEARYNFSDEDSPIEVVTARLVTRARTETQPRVERAGGTDPETARKGTRSVHFPETAAVEAAIYDGETFQTGTVHGPAVVELPYTTIVVPPGTRITAEPERFVLDPR